MRVGVESGLGGGGVGEVDKLCICYLGYYLWLFIPLSPG